MNILNIRLGFATNSSSTHSIVLLPKRQEALDTGDSFEFHWDYFTASNKSSKANYMAIMLAKNLKGFVTDRQACFITMNLLGKGTQEAILDGDIDHQSVFMLPKDYKGKMVDLEFAKDLSDYIINNDRIAILGGNDNDEEYHPLSGAGQELNLPLPKDQMGLPLICRKEGPSLWTLFNKQTGAKVRVSFNDQDIPPIKSNSPGLCDIKLTDYCDTGCKFCYQASTTNGRHGELDYIERVLSSLSEMEVFECALGGGETTSHPDFLDILKYGIKKGLTMNFTTKSLKWLQDKDYALEVLSLVGGFAYSVGSRAELLEVICALDELKKGSGVNVFSKASCQLVMGTIERGVFARILRTCSSYNLRATLLGYKATGFGVQYKPQDYSWWLDVIKELDEDRKLPYLGIDTQLAKEFKGGLEKAGISKYMYRVHEGEDSCYIDCVNKKMAPSSYCHPELYKDLPYPYSDLKETWDELEVI